ncbi:MAG: ABC-F family ATP-binding cassette domain-containing protein [Clostridia bacterium]|nr:ABC-F family ATP-binding cassette domain-containing protein [Clostridia bacterium]
MALLSLSNISKSYGINKVFDNVSFTIEENHRIGFVGINGSGKTTLFKIICDQLSYDNGEIFKSKNLRIGYVEQFTCSDSKRTVLEELLTIQQELINMEVEIEELQSKIELLAYEDKIEKNETRKNETNIELEALINRKHNLENLYSEKGGYTYKSIGRSTLLGLGFEEKELDLKVSELSGGQKTKLTLAKLLFSNSNLLLLDEPTNNLDIASIEWLENFLLNFKGSYIVISHDRYFLDKVTKETFELESHRLSVYKGSYTTYIKLKEEKNKALSKRYDNTQKEINRLEKVIEQQKTWSQEHNYKTIKSKQKMIDRLESSLEKPDEEMEQMKFHFKTISGGNREVLITRDLTMSFENKELFKNVNINVYKGENVFIVGPNGCGKTTLLKIIQGKLKQDSGEYILGSNMKIAYYSQASEELEGNKTILEYVWNAHQKLTQTEVRKALAIFLFKGEDVNKQISTLSGGEKARVALLMIMLSESNFLILDEPTNHLDILSREALENALQEYEGTMLVVSHDRYFINKLANKIYRITKNASKEFLGNYDYYIQNNVEEVVKVVKEKNLSYKEKKEQEAAIRKKNNRLKKLEEEIAINEEKIKELEKLAETKEYATDYVKAMELTEKINDLKSNNEDLYIEWMELNS